MHGATIKIKGKTFTALNKGKDKSDTASCQCRYRGGAEL